MKEKKEEIDKFKADKIEKDFNTAIPITQRIYGKIVYILTAIVAYTSLIFIISSIIMPFRNIFAPNTVIFSIFNGKSIQEIWSSVNCASFSLLNFGALFHSDFWINSAIIFGCLWPAIALCLSTFYFVKEKSWLFAIISIWIILLIELSSSGIISSH